MTMKGLVQVGFGSPGAVLRIEDVERPQIEDGEVLVRVRAASIHVGDVFTIRGVPKAMRLVFRSMRADNGVVGTDMAGTVEEVGAGVTHLRAGDDVFGTARGAFAELAAARADLVARKPTNVTFEQASAVGVSAFTALQALRDRGRLREGQSVLVTGASGGVGSFAVQIARSMGGVVTGVCSARNAELVRSIGAVDVIDYTNDDYTQLGPQFDLILDNIGDHSLKDTRRALNAGGKLIPNGAGHPSGWFGGLGRPLGAAIVSLFVKAQGSPFVSRENKEDLAALTELVESGEVVPLIDRTHPFDEAIQAIDHVAGGHTRGTTVITMSAQEAR